MCDGGGESINGRFLGLGLVAWATQAVILRFLVSPACAANAINPTGYNSIKVSPLKTYAVRWYARHCNKSYQDAR